MFLPTFEPRTHWMKIRISIHYKCTRKQFFIASYIHKSTTISTQFLFQYSSLLKNNPGDNQSRLANIYWWKHCTCMQKNVLFKID